MQKTKRKADWVPVWLDASARHQDLAEAATERGSSASAGDAFLRAALAAHWASLFAVGAVKSETHQRAVDLYRRGALYFEPPAERLEIPHDDDVLPGYLRLPYGVERPPVVLMIGGADTNKEELHHWGTEFTRRGLAVLAFDGPGQGELSARYGRLVMRFDTYHRAVSSVLDFIKTRPDLDASRVGVFGNSLGGYLGLDAGLRDDQVAAVICNGGFYDARSLDEWPDPVMKAFSSCLGIDDPRQVREHIRDHLNLGATSATASPAALIVHGGREDLSGEDELRDAARLVRGQFVVVKDGWHTCTNRDHLVSPLFADWMFNALNSNVRVGFREVRCRDERDYASAIG